MIAFLIDYFSFFTISDLNSRSGQITFSPKTDQSGAVVVFTSAFCGKVYFSSKQLR